MADDTELLQIKIFPNTGHHYYFIPLKPEWGDPAQTKALEDVCKLQNQPWIIARTPGSEPTSSVEVPWVRCRFGAKGPHYGVWLAVESNLGSKERGFPYEANKQVAERPLLPKDTESPTPYACSGTTNPEPATVQCALPMDSNVMLDLARITWMEPGQNEPRKVDLLVDFGNTRTLALLLEQQDGTPVSQRLNPVRFMKRGWGYEVFDGHPADDPCVLVDSWFIVHETMFSQFEPPAPGFTPEVVYQTKPAINWLGRATDKKTIVGETTYVPQMFVDLAPVLFGGGHGVGSAHNALQTLSNFEKGANYFLSSPKRYAWDTDLTGVGKNTVYWCMIHNKWNLPNNQQAGAQLPLLQGHILRFMPPDGRVWKLGEPPYQKPFGEQPQANDKPTHPRADALTWVALSVLEQAYHQIHSEAYRKQLSAEYVPRKLRSVLVTFPAGWTKAELDCYKSRWEYALNIFAHAHLEDPVRDKPRLDIDFDEAVAAQLPIIYSEMNNLPGSDGWLALMGRGKGIEARLRAMNVDVGGGTTDISIVEYQNTLSVGGVHLVARTLFKNSSNIAGDAMVKRIIERVLLPKLGDRFPKDSPQREKFRQFFSNPPADLQAKVPAFHLRLARIVRLVFIPIVHTWLRETVLGTYGDVKDPGSYGFGYKPESMTARDGAPAVDEAQVRDLNDLARDFIGCERGVDILPWKEHLGYNRSLLKECIGEEFRPLFQSLAKLVAAFDCDVVFASGKPSELPQVEERLRRELPLLPQRIIFARGFPAGDWYPLSAGTGRIDDAKTITAVGSALFQAMKIGLNEQGKPSWKIESKVDTASFSDNIWGDCGAPKTFDDNPFLAAKETEKTCDMLMGTRIGRKRYRSRLLPPDPVYRLRWRAASHRDQAPRLTVTLTREKSDDSAESLALTAVAGTDSDGKAVTLEDVELQVCTLPSQGFWMDNPRFDIVW